MSHKFDASIPTSAIKSREGAGKRMLSYIDGHYAITKANELLGHESWSYTTDYTSIVQCEQKPDQYGKDKWHIGYTACVTVKWEGVTRQDVGFGSGIDSDLGKAHESAIKEAATDALKRALRSFGQAFGLALYDKSGEFIEDDSKPKTKNEASVEAQEPAVSRVEQAWADMGGTKAEWVLLGKTDADRKAMVKRAKENGWETAAEVCRFAQVKVSA